MRVGTYDSGASYYHEDYLPDDNIGTEVEGGRPIVKLERLDPEQRRCSGPDLLTRRGVAPNATLKHMRAVNDFKQGIERVHV